MATLNYNWQLIAEASGSLNGNTCNVRIYAKLNSQSTTTNSSSVSYQSRLYYGGGYFYTGSTTTKSISGTGASGSSQDGSGTYNGGETTLQTITGTVYHDNSGNANVSMSANFYASPWSYNTTVNGSASLPKIARFATMTSATNFNDEGNPSFTFNNPANASMSCWLEPKPSNTHVAVRTLSGSGGTYTWNLTEAERDQLRNMCTDGTSCKCRIGLYSTIGGSTQASYKDVTMTIINANPVFTDFDYNDINSTTLALTGNSKYNINGYSTIRVSISTTNKATALKGATMTKYRFIVGDSTKEVNYSDSETVYIDLPNASIGTYQVYAVDSRNNATLVTKLSERNIEYTPIYLDKQNSYTERDDGGIGENVSLKYQGIIWNESFGQVSNSLILKKYEFKETSSQTWITGTTDITPTITDNTFSFYNLVRSNLPDYTFDVEKSYNFRLTFQDKLSTTIVELTPLTSGIPNISLNKNGVGIMCDYDESLGGLLQVGGEIYKQNKPVVDYTITSAVHSIELNIPNSTSTDIYEMYLLGTVSSSANQDIYVQFNDITTGYYTCMMLQSTTATSDGALSGSNIYRANKSGFYNGSSLAHTVSGLKYDFFISNNRILCNWHTNIFGDGSTLKGVGEASGYINSSQTSINKVKLTANISDSNQKLNTGTRIVIFKK